MDHASSLDRRTLIAGGTLLTAALATPATGAVPLTDFSFEDGRWAVRHRTLRKRLAGTDQWHEFNGTTLAGPLMGGLACYEDNVLDAPTGRYRAAALRRFEPRTGLWSIWWWDERFAQVDPPVVGKFENGVGTFFGDSMWEGKPIKVRFIWDMPMPGAPRWQQAFSADGGVTWETNWYMEFRR
jgi:hypothetical protein